MYRYSHFVLMLFLVCTLIDNVPVPLSSLTSRFVYTYIYLRTMMRKFYICCYTICCNDIYRTLSLCEKKLFLALASFLFFLLSFFLFLFLSFGVRVFCSELFDSLLFMILVFFRLVCDIFNFEIKIHVHMRVL